MVFRQFGCYADLDGDDDVDDFDVDTRVDTIGMSSPTHADGDLNGDGYTTITDLDPLWVRAGGRELAASDGSI